MDRERRGRDGPSTKRLPKRSFALRGLCSQKLPLADGARAIQPACLAQRHLACGVATLAKQTQLVAIIRVIVSIACTFANVDHGLGGHIAAGRSGLSIALRCRASKAKSTLLLYGAKGCACARNARTVLKYGVLGYTNQTPNCIFRRNHPLCELIGLSIPGLPCGALVARNLPKAGLDISLRKVINLRSQGNAPLHITREGAA